MIWKSCGPSCRAALICAALPGCTDAGSSRDVVPAAGASGVFGGSVLEDGGIGGSAGTGGSAGAAGSSGRCGAVPTATERRIDNFEDGDPYPVPEPGRSGAWSTRDDGSGGTISLSVDEGGANATDFAAHVLAQGFTENASFDLGLWHLLDGVQCPYNAGDFSGLSFFSKGAGRVELMAHTTDVFSTEFGGTCDDSVEQCWDVHRKLVPLAAEWTYHEVRWQDLTQAGWGKYAMFDPTHLLGLSFRISAAHMPMELWIDEVQFLPGDGGEAGEP